MAAEPLPPSEPHPELELHTLAIMRAILDGGSITAAARRLGYSQPAITQHIQRVEKRLGMSLVIRTGRTVGLTEAGAVLARHALTINATLTAVGDELALLAGVQSGRVTLVGFPTASATIVPPLLALVRSRHPGLVVRYAEAEPPEAVALLREGGADLAITFSYAGDRQDPHGFRASDDGNRPFDHLDLATDEMLVVLPPTRGASPPSDEDPTRRGISIGLDAKDPPLHLADLADQEWIAGCPLCRGHLLSACHEAGFEPTIGYETDNFVAVANMVAAGLGVALLPQLAARSTRLPDGTRVRRTEPRLDRTLHLLTARGRGDIPSVSAVTAAILDLDPAEWGLGAPVSGRKAKMPSDGPAR